MEELSFVSTVELWHIEELKCVYVSRVQLYCLKDGHSFGVLGFWSNFPEVALIEGLM